MGFLNKIGLAKRDFKDRTAARVARRGKRKGLTKKEIKAETTKRINAKAARHEKLKDVGKGIGKVILPVASTAATIIPGGNFLGAGLNKIPLVNKVPVVKELAAVGDSFIKEEIEAGGSMKTALIKDIFEILIRLWDLLEDALDKGE